MVCEAEELFPHASVAVQVRVTLNEPAQAPAVVTSLKVRVKALPQLSVAEATANTGDAGQSIVEFALVIPLILLIVITIGYLAARFPVRMITKRILNADDRGNL